DALICAYRMAGAADHHRGTAGAGLLAGRGSGRRECLSRRDRDAIDARILLRVAGGESGTWRDRRHSTGRVTDRNLVARADVRLGLARAAGGGLFDRAAAVLVAAVIAGNRSVRAQRPCTLDWRDTAHSWRALAAARCCRCDDDP